MTTGRLSRRALHRWCWVWLVAAFAWAFTPLTQASTVQIICSAGMVMKAVITDDGHPEGYEDVRDGVSCALCVAAAALPPDTGSESVIRHWPSQPRPATEIAGRPTDPPLLGAPPRGPPRRV